MVLTDSRIAHFSEGIIKTPCKNLSAKLGRKPEQIYTIGTDLIYQIRPACNSPSHCCAVCISLHGFILRGAGEKGPLFSKNNMRARPQKAPPNVSKLFRLGKPFFQQSRLEGRGGLFLGREKAVLCAGCSLLCRRKGLHGRRRRARAPGRGRASLAPRGWRYPRVGRRRQGDICKGAAPSPCCPPSFRTQKGKIRHCVELFFNRKRAFLGIKIRIFQSLQSRFTSWGGKKKCEITFSSL